jgi:hypothetical protein
VPLGRYVAAQTLLLSILEPRRNVSLYFLSLFARSAGVRKSATICVVVSCEFCKMVLWYVTHCTVFIWCLLQAAGCIFSSDYKKIDVKLRVCFDVFSSMCMRVVILTLLLFYITHCCFHISAPIFLFVVFPLFRL